jgi:hypothetical protein
MNVRLDRFTSMHEMTADFAAWRALYAPDAVMT